MVWSREFRKLTSYLDAETPTSVFEEWAPLDLQLTSSQHRCPSCSSYFQADSSDLALPNCHYTLLVQAIAVRVVVEDGLSYRAAEWHLWRDHRVFVPWATIQNWVEGSGKKGASKAED